MQSTKTNLMKQSIYFKKEEEKEKEINTIKFLNFEKNTHCNFIINFIFYFPKK